MKLYAIVEINDEDYEGDFEEWYITGDDLDIRYADNGYRYYKAIPGNMLKLKPLPQKKNTEMSLNAINDWLEHSERIGFNKCLDEILGEEENESD